MKFVSFFQNPHTYLSNVLYLSKMRGWEKKLRVWFDWQLDLFFSRDISRLKVLKKESQIDYKELDEVDEVW